MYRSILLLIFLWSLDAFASDNSKVRADAENGDAEAQYTLGMSYLYGTKFPGDEQVGIDWLRRAAEQGYARAQSTLGVAYVAGTGVVRDPAQANAWFKRAADQGDSDAQFSLGMAYRLGSGVAKDEKEGLAWIRRSVDQSNATAQAYVAEMYFRGDGVDKDYAQGAKWARLSADQGNPMGQAHLGIAYLHGFGVGKDVKKGLELLRLSAGMEVELAVQVLRDYEYEQARDRQYSGYTSENFRKEAERRERTGAQTNDANARIVPATSMPSFTPSIPSNDPYQTTNPLDCSYGMCGSGGSSPASSSRLGESAGLYKEEGAGGGYLTCHYRTSGGYHFTTTSSGTCPGSVTVDPQSGQAW